MNRIKLSENFFVDEFCPKEIHDLIEKGEAKLSDFQDSRIPLLAQWIRTEVKKSVNINNWIDGGNLDERGVRMPNTSTGAKKSRHKYEVNAEGKIIRKSDALDIQIGTMTGKQMYDWAYENKEQLFELGVRTIEHYTLTPSWLHMDLHPRTNAKNTITIVTLNGVAATWTLE